MNAMTLWTVLVPLSEELPGENDYKPGWVLFAIIMFLAVAVVVLAFSFRKQLRKADRHFGASEGGAGNGGTIGDSDSAAGDDRSD
jgi:hypothetical protein